VEGEEKPFLLDPTYIQFFHQEKCQKSAFFVSPIFVEISGIRIVVLRKKRITTQSTRQV
jgi:hypothetical protein